MAPKIERIADIPNQQVGEGPHWDDATQSLYFVDIFAKTINRYVPSKKRFTRVFLEKQASFIIPVKGSPGRFIVGLENEFVIITWDGESDKLLDTKVIGQVERGFGNLNDGKCDSLGRLWSGTVPIIEEILKYPIEQCVLISLEKSDLKTHISKISLSNGLAWNYALKKFYYIDTHIGTVDEFDFDIEKRTIANRKPVFTLKKHGIDGFPDGMTIDTNGNLWVACFRGSKVVKIDPRRSETLLDSITFPVSEITSVAFGGPNLDVLYVTSGNTKKEVGDQLGAVFEVTGLNARGLPADTFAF